MGEHPQAYPTATLAATIVAALPHERHGPSSEHHLSMIYMDSGAS